MGEETKKRKFERTRWEFIGFSPNVGKEYKKGVSLMIFYNNGDKKLWSEFPGIGYCRRTIKGRESWS